MKIITKIKYMKTLAAVFQSQMSFSLIVSKRDVLKSIGSFKSKHEPALKKISTKSYSVDDFLLRHSSYQFLLFSQ